LPFFGTLKVKPFPFWNVSLVSCSSTDPTYAAPGPLVCWPLVNVCGMDQWALGMVHLTRQWWSSLLPSRKEATVRWPVCSRGLLGRS
jgi:hypothetical protein